VVRTLLKLAWYVVRGCQVEEEMLHARVAQRHQATRLAADCVIPEGVHRLAAPGARLPGKCWVDDWEAEMPFEEGTVTGFRDL
jgi:hypothetical protein